MYQYSFQPQPLLNRKEQRKQRAKETAEKVIPDHLRSVPRARHGIHRAELVNDPPAAISSLDDSATSLPARSPKIRVQCRDTLTAAGRYADRPYASRRNASTVKDAKSQKPNVAVLNMAMPTRPGGGFLDGANSQEEFLCARTTLFPALWDAYYPLPAFGGVWTPDVMVFRDTTPEANDLEKRDRYFIDVISAGMLRFPDARGRSEERSGNCTCGITFCDRDRDVVTRKMKAVLRMAESRGTEKLILGAWGCGAFSNPVKEIAKLWRKVLVGGSRQRKPNSERWEGIKEIVFAVPDQTMVREFNIALRDVLATDAPTPRSDEDGEVTILLPEDEEANAELMLKIAEVELQIEQTFSARGKALLRQDLAVLRRDLAQGSSSKATKDEDLAAEQDEEDEEYVFSGFQPSDGEENSIYNFDENDIASDSSDCPTSDAFEFHAGPGLQSRPSEDELEENPENFHTLLPPSEKYDNRNGWYAGSVDELHAYLKASQRNGSRAPSRSPQVRPESGYLDVEHLHRRAFAEELTRRDRQ